jgi:hypothetical protein
MPRRLLTCLSLGLVALPLTVSTGGAQEQVTASESCRSVDFHGLGRNPTRSEMRCRFGVQGPGRFGLLSYADVPVYQPVTPMPGTHLIGVAGQARPQPYETFEEWEWRVLGTRYGADVLRVHSGLDLLAPDVLDRIRALERRLSEARIPASRRETWRAPQRQAYLFQQGRSRPGALATTTLTSWHSQMDEFGNPAGRAVDYDVPGWAMPRFHEIAHEVGLESFGADSYDPGHVFLPLPGAVPAGELALLRTLPRVPEVTLSTGLPSDRPLPAGGRDALRQASFAFATSPFLPPPNPQVATLPPAAFAVLALETVEDSMAGRRVTVAEPPPSRSVFGGVRGARRTGGENGVVVSGRSTDGPAMRP